MPIEMFYVVSLRDQTVSNHSIVSLARMFHGHWKVEGDLDDVQKHFAIFTDLEEAKKFAAHQKLLAELIVRLTYHHRA